MEEWRTGKKGAPSRNRNIIYSGAVIRETLGNLLMARGLTRNVAVCFAPGGSRARCVGAAAVVVLAAASTYSLYCK